MTQTLRKSALQIFALLPKPHRLGLITLCGLLIVVGLTRTQSSKEQPIPIHNVSILATSAHASPINEYAQASALNMLNVTQPSIDNSADTDASTDIDISQAKPTNIEHILNPLAVQQIVTQPVDKNTYHTETVNKGDTLAAVFKRAGVNAKYMYHLLHNHKEAKSLAKIFPGHQLKFVSDDKGKLIALHHIKDALNKQVFTRNEANYDHEEIVREPEIRLARTEGTITHSLYAAAKEAHLEDRLTMSLANIFGWDVDFALDIRKNDSFAVVYEEKYLDGKRLGTGDIIAAEFTNKGDNYQAVRYVDSTGNAQYYTPQGRTMRKAFLRSPIEFARISSHFNLKRKHPILNTIRAHKGTDYAAPRGTPIKTTGDGKVIFAGRKNGYGNVLIIQHGQTYETRYAHLKGFAKNVRRGKTVKQGQVVAYVGTTGLSTAPHLHYEFRVNGAVRNPVTVKLPKANPIAKAERERFFAQTKPLIAQLNNLPPATQIATQKTDASGTTAM